jgi:hypothetical protein
MDRYRGRRPDTMRMVWRRKAGSHENGMESREPFGSVISNFCCSTDWGGNWRNETGGVWASRWRFRQLKNVFWHMPSRVQYADTLKPLLRWDDRWR